MRPGLSVSKCESVEGRPTGVWLLLAVVLLGGCVKQEQIEPDESLQVQRELQAQLELQDSLRAQVAELQAQLRKKDSEVAGLHLKVLEQHAEIDQLLLSQQYAVQEVVRTKAKLRSRVSKAEAVAHIAEVKMMIKTVEAGSKKEQQERILRQARQMISLSEEALKEGNIDGASYLSDKSLRLIQPVREQQLNQESLKQPEEKTVFATPLKLTVLKRSNVRNLPHIKADVLFQLASGRVVTALAYTQNWIQIEDESQGRGWVYYELLGISK